MRLLLSLLAAVLLSQPLLETCVLAQTKKPLILGHRGACGHRPEHTLASYELAVEMGADFIEPDLVSTKDGVLVARHENDITGTTDVAQKFPDRKKKKSIDGQEIEGFFTEDFTLAELKTLKAKERLEFRDHSHDGKFDVPTFQEVIDLAKRLGKEKGRVIGIYPETKHPTYFRSIGLGLEAPLVKALKEAGWDKADSPVFIQSFEIQNLKDLKGMIGVPLVFLYDEPDMRPYDFVAAGDKRTFADLMKPAELAGIAAFAKGVGPWKRLIVGENPDKSLKAPNTFIEDAHKAGLVVHPYTFRNEARYLAPDYKGDPKAEYLQFFRLGVDGVFSDFPDTAFAAREEFLKQ